MQRTTDATDLLVACGAETIAHPGGTLFAHLRRVHAKLVDWQAGEDVRLAGLCHAAYGTDGFATSLLPLEDRSRLAEIIGTGAEELVYFYASCDRAFSYRGLAERDGVFRDRFTGTELVPTDAQRRDFAAITVANELDLVGVNADFATEHGSTLLALFTRFRPLLADSMWQDVTDVLG